MLHDFLKIFVRFTRKNTKTNAFNRTMLTKQISKKKVRLEKANTQIAFPFSAALMKEFPNLNNEKAEEDIKSKKTKVIYL
jgi:hypothetical protein